MMPPTSSPTCRRRRCCRPVVLEVAISATLRPSVTKTTYKDAWKELPDDWLEGLDIKTQVASQTYRTSINRYGVNCGVKTDKSDSFGLKAWETSGWMAAQDPYGWFQWYCRFFQGRRSDDDERQLSRWMKCCGPKGRWKSNFIGKCSERWQVV